MSDLPVYLPDEYWVLVPHRGMFSLFLVPFPEKEKDLMAICDAASDEGIAENLIQSFLANSLGGFLDEVEKFFTWRSALKIWPHLEHDYPSLAMPDMAVAQAKENLAYLKSLDN
jgi:hypothetical protein